MGSSSSSPKRNDRTPLPQLKKSGGAVEGGGVTYNSEENTCPLVFRVPLSNTKMLKADLQLLIGTDGVVKFSTHVVGQLSPHQWRTYQRCTVQGVTYSGTVVISKKGGERIYYGEFRQR